MLLTTLDRASPTDREHNHSGEEDAMTGYIEKGETACIACGSYIEIHLPLEIQCAECRRRRGELTEEQAQELDEFAREM